MPACRHARIHTPGFTPNPTGFTPHAYTAGHAALFPTSLHTPPYWIHTPCPQADSHPRIHTPCHSRIHTPDSHHAMINAGMPALVPAGIFLLTLNPTLPKFSNSSKMWSLPPAPMFGIKLGVVLQLKFGPRRLANLFGTRQIAVHCPIPPGDPLECSSGIVHLIRFTVLSQLRKLMAIIPIVERSQGSPGGLHRAAFLLELPYVRIQSPS